MEIKTKLDALSFLYNFDQYAEREREDSYLFMFPFELADGDIDVFHIYKEGERWAIIDEEISPDAWTVRNVELRELVDYVFCLREAVNYGIKECVS